MGYVHPDQPDNFVSFAHVDDKIPVGVKAKLGWVSTFTQSLKDALARKLGREDSFDLWMDYRLPGNVPLTPRIDDRVSLSATIIIVLSPGYLASEWCGRELELFLNEEVRRRKGHGSTAVFVVAFDEVSKADCPPSLRELRGYRFWEKGRDGRPTTLGFPRLVPSDEKRYYDVLGDLTHDLVAELKRQKQARPEATEEPAPGIVGPEPLPDDAPTIYLAEATDDLDDLPDQLRRFLAQPKAGLRCWVLPDRLYPRDSAEVFLAAARADIERSLLVVQLLGDFAGKQLAGSDRGIVALQHACATELGKPAMRWRKPGTDATQARADLKPLLADPDVRADDFQEFKDAIVARIEALTCTPKRTIKEEKDLPRFVFVHHADENDWPLARSIMDGLESEPHAIPCLYLEPGLAPDELRKDLNQNLKECDGMLLVYGQAPRSWVRSQLLHASKMEAEDLRDRPLPIVAVYEGPPPPKGGLGVRMPRLNLHTVTCLHQPQPDPAIIGRFVETLRRSWNP